jgi:RNA ligase (TIGR02306 family)
MSEHRIEIVQIGKIEPHANADRLAITRIWGWQCCIGKDDFKEGDLAIYIPPDYLVPISNPSFAFLKREDGKPQERIRVRRFKGALSQGLLIPVPPELLDRSVGANVIAELGIERYEPPLPMSSGGLFVGGPSGLYCPKFDVECYQRYFQMFTAGEPVVITEKIHGANARYTYAQDKDGEWKQFCGSRTNWLAEDDKNYWWMAFHRNPAIGEWCKEHPTLILYGEVFGQVQKLKYGAKRNDVFFAAFAVLKQNQWLDFDEAYAMVTPKVAWVPLLYKGPFDAKIALSLSEGRSTWPGADHVREGCVIIPEKERNDAEIGRVMLKIVSDSYLEKDA